MDIENRVVEQEKLFNESLNNSSIKEEFKILDLFEEIYSYPPKFKVRLYHLDELQHDWFVNPDFKMLDAIPFSYEIQDWIGLNPKERQIEIEKESLLEKYGRGYRNKNYTSSFYKNKLSSITNALKPIPVYTILNGRGEIILSSPEKNIPEFSAKNYVNQKLYDFCGGFEDHQYNRESKLGLFFFSYEDAKVYMDQVILSDPVGAKLLGVTIHSISLDSAYKITKEFHPGTDFRFIPDFKEMTNLASTYLDKSSIVFDEMQQQLRCRRRPVSILPNIGALQLNRLTPFFSFSQNAEYFKGVPIYLVQAYDKPRNILVEQVNKMFNIADNFGGMLIEGIDYVTGFGQNWIMQGSIQNVSKSKKVTTYVFFEYKEAENFINEHGRKIARHGGARVTNFEPIIRKPKIYITCLEDFIELWESKLLLTEKHYEIMQKKRTIFDTANTYFIPPKTNLDLTFKTDINNWQRFKQSVQIKSKLFTFWINDFLAGD